MKRRHRIPPEAYFTSDPITPAYQAQVDRSMARASRRELDALTRLATAEARLAKAQQIKATPQRQRAVLVAHELIELRRQELLAVQRAMSSAPSSATHRGLGHRKHPVPDMRTL